MKNNEVGKMTDKTSYKIKHDYHFKHNDEVCESGTIFELIDGIFVGVDGSEFPESMAWLFEEV